MSNTRIRVGIAQINTQSGNIEYNAKKILDYIEKAEEQKLNLVVFPELSLMGYPLGDALGKFPFLVDENEKWLKEISKRVRNITAVIGFVEKGNYNSVAIVRDGKIQKIIRQSITLQCVESNDYKYLKPAPDEDRIFEIDGYKFGILIGREQAFLDVDIAINCCALTNKMSNFIPKKGMATIYVNQVGCTDNIVFEGNSCAYSKEGNLINKSELFEEEMLIINPFDIGKEVIISETSDIFDLSYSDIDLERTYKTSVHAVKDYFNKTGLERAVLGLSGGLDSTVCAVILADALGKENVYGVSMPSKITSQESKNDGKVLAENLGINYIEMPIKDLVDSFNNIFQSSFDKIELDWGRRYKQSYTNDNIQARARATYLWCISNEFERCIPIATSDKSEAYMGYATINGDMTGGFAPIGDITKTKLFALAKWLNKNRTEKNVIPESVILKRPGAELAIDPKTGKPLIAEDALMPYDFLDEVIWRIEKKQQTYSEILNSTFCYEKNNDISLDQKQEWLDKFFRRMSAALFKKSILPPIPIIDSEYVYKQPITSGKINYKGYSEEEIAKILSE